MATKKVKPSEVLRLAAELVDDYNRGVGPSNHEFGCHALQKAAIKLEALSERPLMFEDDLQAALRIIRYFEMMRYPGSVFGVWFSERTHRQAGFRKTKSAIYGEHRVMALLMAAAIAESEGE